MVPMSHHHPKYAKLNVSAMLFEHLGSKRQANTRLIIKSIVLLNKVYEIFTFKDITVNHLSHPGFGTRRSGASACWCGGLLERELSSRRCGGHQNFSSDPESIKPPHQHFTHCSLESKAKKSRTILVSTTDLAYYNISDTISVYSLVLRRDSTRLSAIDHLCFPV